MEMPKAWRVNIALPSSEEPEGFSTRCADGKGRQNWVGLTFAPDGNIFLTERNGGLGRWIDFAATKKHRGDVTLN